MTEPTSPSAYTYLEGVAAQLRQASEQGTAHKEETTVRELLRECGADRRGKLVVDGIQNALERLGLHTVPDFERVWSLDTPIVIELSEVPTADPTIRVEELDAARRKPIVVDPHKSLRHAMTKMLTRDFSQLPVATKSRRKLYGLISWESIGDRSASDPASVRECMNKDVKIVAHHTPLLDAVADIARYGYTLVRGRDDTLSGIVTAADVVQLFMDLSEPFLLLQEIEGHLRSIVHGRFSPNDLSKDCDRPISGTADLTLGEYCQVIGKEERWKALELDLCRKVFLERLQRIREVRNDVMHFSPDGISDEDVQALRSFARFFRTYRAKAENTS